MKENRKIKAKLGILAICFICIFSMSLLMSHFTFTALAESTSDNNSPFDSSNLKFTSINSGTAYSVSAANKTLTNAVIPASYNGLPVIEIGSGGFMSCTQLTEVVIASSNTLKTIRSNAFMNCSKLETVVIGYGVQTIEQNAFALCTKLSGLIIPNSVTSVGATVLRNNPNPIYVRGSMAGWNANWSSNYLSAPVLVSSNELIYEEKLDSQGNAVSSVIKGQALNSANLTTEIPATHDELPVAVESFAFAGSRIGTLDLTTYYVQSGSEVEFDDTYAGYEFIGSEIERVQIVATERNLDFNDGIFAFAIIDLFEVNLDDQADEEYSVNFRSNSFVDAHIETIIFNGKVTFNDGNQKAVNVFQNAIITTILLPSDMEEIPAGMFSGSIIENIGTAGLILDRNHLPSSVKTISSEAFMNASITDLYIFDNIEYIDSNTFSGWNESQTILFEGNEVDSLDWNENWNGGDAVITFLGDAAITPVYSITYNLDGGTNHADNPATLEAGHDPVTLQDPSKFGHVFDGWYLDEDFTTEIETLEDLDGDIELYAKFSLLTYSVTNNIANTSLDISSATHGQEFNALLTPDIGYSLPTIIYIQIDGVDADFGYNSNTGAISIDGWDVTGDIVISGEADRITYNIEANNLVNATISPTWVYHGDEYSGAIAVNSDYSRPASIVVTVNGVELGEDDFSYNPSTGAVVIGEEFTISDIEIAGTAVRSVYAVTNSVSYTSLDNLSATHGEQYQGQFSVDSGYNLPSSVTVTVNGNTLSSAFYSFNSGLLTIPQQYVTGDITVSGSAVLKTYNVTDSISYGTLSPSGSNKATHGVEYTGSISASNGYYSLYITSVKVNNEAISNYSVSGGGYSATITIPAETVTGNIVISGYFSEDYWPVTYRPGNHSTGSTYYATKYHFSALTLRGETYYRDGYKQDGWSTKADGTTKDYELNDDYTKNASVNLYPYWTLNEYRIDYVLNGGVNHSSNPSTYTPGETIYLLPATRSGYIFDGWYSDPIFRNEVTGITSTSTGDKTFYAKWVAATTFTVNFVANAYVTFIPDSRYTSQMGFDDSFVTYVPAGNSVRIQYTAKAMSSGVKLSVNGVLQNFVTSITVTQNLTITAVLPAGMASLEVPLVITEQVIDGEIVWVVDVAD